MLLQFLGAVYRDSLYDQVDTEECPNLAVRSVNLHLEEFVNVCSFHLWSSMLQSVRWGLEQYRTLSLSFIRKVDLWIITNTNQSYAEFNDVFISKNGHHYSNRSCRDLNLCVIMISKIGILPIGDQLLVSERLFYQHLGIHVY